MLDTILNTLTEATRHLAENRERRFEKIAVPIYDGMAKAHQDYLGLFEQSLCLLGAGASSKEAAAALADARLTDESQRHILLAQAAALLNVKDLEAARPILRAVVEYFENSPFSGGNTPSDMLLKTLHALESEADVAPIFQGNQQESMEHAIRIMLDQLRENWAVLSTEFARQRA